jgi:streptogramin lyase
VRRPNQKWLYLLLPVLLAVTSMVLFGARAEAPVKVPLAGTITSVDDKPLEGITVSARASGQTFTTTVYTNQAGQFAFPGLSEGDYQIRVQAVGFKQVLQQRTISPSTNSKLNLTLEARPDFAVQMSSIEWVSSLPAETPSDRRMKSIFVYTCSECHTAGFVLSKRFDSAGWSIIVDTMMKYQTSPNSLAHRILENYKGELVAYLTRIRGPEPFDWKFQPQPRPKGVETNVVVTEYLIPRGDHPDVYVDEHNGTDWDEGVPSRNGRTVLHDAVPGTDGFVYFTDNRTPERAFGKLDPESGHVTTYKLLDKDGSGPITHGIDIDKAGVVWATNQTDSTFLGFDPKTEKFLRYQKPPTMIVPRPMVLMAIDSKGVMWGSEPHGALRLDPKSGVYTEFNSVRPGGMPYGMGADSEDNAWFAKFQDDGVGFVDSKSGQVDEVILPTLGEEIPAKDIEIAKKTGMINGVPAVYQVGPRRLGTDHHGDGVWVGEYFAGRLSKIDIHTKKVTEHPVPGGRYAHPYAIAVDKDHMVWFSMANTDQIGRFDPTTGQFTKFPLPTRGSESRAIAVDDSTSPPTIWVSYFASNKIARVQILPEAATQVSDKK